MSVWDRRPANTTSRSINALGADDLSGLLSGVCTAPEWIANVVAARPYETVDELLAVSDHAVASLTAEGLSAALDGHPRIGERSGHAASAREQAAVLAAGDDFAGRMADANARYEERFGHVYLVAAAGRKPDELLGLLETRLANDPGTENTVVRRELAAINRSRLAALLPANVPVSTHVLDTTTGRPVVGMRVELIGPDGPVADGITDTDGRIPGFALVRPGRYTAIYHTGDHFPDGLYPQVAITVDLRTGKVHLPLLLSPFAYSTYRGS
ncbi:MAG: 2-oxo-4-hydroxy-4-carboxy-5-ureidoimidazoline decarboxylase [Gordonia sp. (in: high G+C Gram-positive bacteria)]|uniref:2-oxo-4-hydroxy-4-carboxy-5-ureidoimidazoline decarboxylase n=1 Tax=Gordonia sp. (in: high G+C Gram-positive bacteria) TaxID=84139 RepID=UPI0039E6AB18